MNVDAILNMVMTGIRVATTLAAAGKEAAPVLMDIVETFGADGKKEVSQEEVDAFEKRLDGKIDDFNRPIEPRSEGR